MKHRIALFIVLIIFVLPLTNQDVAHSNFTQSSLRPGLQDYSAKASNSGRGTSLDVLLYGSKQISNQQLLIANSYMNPSQHIGQIDFSSYLISGWSLYEVEIEMNSITAIAERETMGIATNNYIKIENNTGIVSDALYQEFYKQPHDGRLENYTFTYSAPYYDSANLGQAYLVVRSDYSDPQTNVTGWTTPFSLQITDTILTRDCSGENAILNATKSYYVVIDGTTMTGVYFPLPINQWEFNTIWWRARSPYLGLDTGRRIRNDNWYPYVGGDPREAELNYTYTPWNRTSDGPLVYSQPSSINLKGNSSNLVGTSWTFNDIENITSISFNSNQSVKIDYNLTLWYRKTGTSTTSWSGVNSGADINWSVQSTLNYPMFVDMKFLNISIPTSWRPSGLFNSTHPSVNHTSYFTSGDTVSCSQLSNDTWTLKALSYNYINAIQTYDASDDGEVFGSVSILVDTDVNITILEPDSDPVTTGLANLTIIKAGAVVWSPANKSVTNGKADYLWNIDNTTSDNGAYTIEVSWANGTDAGYLVRELTVYYPTTLTSLKSDINAFTESTFEVRAYFEDSFTQQGLYGSAVDVSYSFDGSSNVTMTDHDNGTWSAVISTTGKDSGKYVVDIYAQGYAVQNRSTQVNIYLIHDTETLAVEWSNTNDITYIETTQLTVHYNRTTGSTPILGATVNVTIDGTTWPLVWDGISAYRITFNGTDVPPGFGVHSLTIEAWKTGHKAQSDTTQTLTIQEEPTSMDYFWSNSNSITYIESTILSVNYTMSDGSPVLSAEINVTIGSDLYDLIWNGGTQTYQYLFAGDSALPGIGVHSLTIRAGKQGYVNQTAPFVSLTITEEPTSLVLKWSNGFNISYIEETYLIVFYNMSDNSPVLGAVVNVTIGTDVFILNYYAPIQGYRILFNGSDSPPGLGTHPITVQADLFGYVSKSDSSETLTLNEDSTTLLLSWSDGDSITYIQQTTLSVSYTMSNSSAIRNALLNVTIGSNTWVLAWHEASETYRRTFYGSDVQPGFGSHALTVEADKFGFLAKSDSSETLTITEVPTNYALTWSNGFDITYIQETYLIVNYTMTDGSPVLSATVNVTINGQAFDLTWYASTLTYRLLIRGSDNPPGFGDFPITVRADRYGYASHTDSTENLTLQEDPTTLLLSWSDGDNITYVEQTILSASYTMSNGSAIRSALLNVTIGGNTWLLVWHEASGTYRKTFLGSDDPPGFGTHSVNVEADLFGFVSRTDSTKQLTIREEPTTLTVRWSNGSSITYVEQTTISVSYRMSNTTRISGATITVTIGVDVWPLTWNPGSEAYEVTFKGTDDPPGIEVHSLSIDASRFGFESQSDNTESLTI
ncbi:MAG: hypothetical protein ACFFCP_13945, partial [Promethearchaeota archaeon]